MQSGYTGHITRKEWRWVLLVSIALVLLAFVPFIWITFVNSSGMEWQFMGALHRYLDATTYLSRIQQGANGEWLVSFLHTPEAHGSTILYPIYTFLGQISRITFERVSPIIVFHVARVSASLFMYLALYQLAATIWMRIRTRRLFFLLVTFSSGLGWVFLAFTGNDVFKNLTPDFNQPQLYPFYSSLVNVHYPLAIAIMALIAAVVIDVFRPGNVHTPSVNNTGIVGFGLSLVLVLVLPDSFLLVVITLVTNVIAHWIVARKMTLREALWLLWILVPALPIIMYYVLTMQDNPFVWEWMLQKSSQYPSPIALVVGLGALLLIGLPSIYRAIRHFESDGDRYMIIWLLTAIIGLYIPFPVHAQFLLGLMIPVAYFATRSLEDVWLKMIPRRRRLWLFIFGMPLLLMNHLYVLTAPILPLINGTMDNADGLVLATDYRVTFEWMARRTSERDVILASPQTSAWIPLWIGSKVVYGHPAETMNSIAKRTDVIQWYRTDDSLVCDALLQGKDSFRGRYRVDFVIYGPLERKIGAGACLNSLEFVASFGKVEVYQVPFSTRR